MMSSVNHVLDVGLGDEGDPFTVGRPRGSAVGAGIGGDLGKVRALVGVVGGDDPDVGVVIAIGIGSAAVAGEGQRFSVGGPSGLVVIEITGGDLSHLLGGDIENEEVIAAVIEVADGVLFKLETVDDERWRSFRFGRRGLVLVLRGFGVFGFWILKDR